jgi:hypothetical protein
LKIPLLWRIVKGDSSPRCSHVTQFRTLFFIGFNYLPGCGPGSSAI